MGDGQKMRYCPWCDVYVGMCEGEIVVLTSDAFRACLNSYYRAQDPHIAEVYERIAWVEGTASERDQYAWFEPDESKKS